MGAAHADVAHADAPHGARAAAGAAASAVEMRWQLDPVRLSRWIASRAEVACWRGSEDFQLSATCLQQQSWICTFEYPSVQSWGKSASNERTSPSVPMAL